MPLLKVKEAETAELGASRLQAQPTRRSAGRGEPGRALLVRSHWTWPQASHSLPGLQSVEKPDEVLHSEVTRSFVKRSCQLRLPTFHTGPPRHLLIVLRAQPKGPPAPPVELAPSSPGPRTPRPPS